MVRFKSVTAQFTSLPNSVIQGFYLTPNALAVLITCLSYPNDWNYRPIDIWKNLKLSRDKTYKAFDELVEHGHCIRIRHKRGNLIAEVDYIFFDQVQTCEKYVLENHKELNSKDLLVDHKWNLKKFLRHPEIRDSGGKEVTKKMCKKRSVIVCVDESPVAPSSHVEKITKVGFDHKEIHISKQNLFEEAVRQREDWTTQEIEDVWKVLVEYKGPMRDWFKFCRGTITNQRKLRKLKELKEKDLECKKLKLKKKQNLREPSENSNETPLENATVGLHLADWRQRLKQAKQSKDT